MGSEDDRNPLERDPVGIPSKTLDLIKDTGMYDGVVHIGPNSGDKSIESISTKVATSLQLRQYSFDLLRQPNNLMSNDDVRPAALALANGLRDRLPLIVRDSVSSDYLSSLFEVILVGEGNEYLAIRIPSHDYRYSNDLERFSQRVTRTMATGINAAYDLFVKSIEELRKRNIDSQQDLVDAMDEVGRKSLNLVYQTENFSEAHINSISLQQLVNVEFATSQSIWTLQPKPLSDIIASFYDLAQGLVSPGDAISPVDQVSGDKIEVFYQHALFSNMWAAIRPMVRNLWTNKIPTRSVEEQIELEKRLKAKGQTIREISKHVNSDVDMNLTIGVDKDANDALVISISTRGNSPPLELITALESGISLKKTFLNLPDSYEKMKATPWFVYMDLINTIMKLMNGRARIYSWVDEEGDEYDRGSRLELTFNPVNF